MASSRARNPLVADPGTVFGFRTEPVYPGISAPDTGRYGAIITLGHNSSLVVIGALEGVWAAMPTLDDVRGRDLLRLATHGGRTTPSVLGCEVKHDVDLAELTTLGVVPLTAAQERIAGKYLGESPLGCSFGVATLVGRHVELEWRKTNDHDALQRERGLHEAQEAAKRAAAQVRFETRLKDLTWQQLLSEDPFARWEPSPPFPPDEFRQAATVRVHEACRELQAMGPKPGKPATRKVLKDLVMWFRDRDRDAGFVIETEEREDVAVVCEEIAHVAKQPALIDEFGPWFDWY